MKYLCNFKNENMENILLLKIFHQEIALHDITNQYLLIICFQLILCDIFKKHGHPILPLRILWMVLSLLLCFLFSMLAILKELCL